MRSMRLVARALAAALVVCAGAEEMVEVFLASDGAEEMVEVFLASDRVIAAAATLNSVCDSAAEPSGLRLDDHGEVGRRLQGDLVHRQHHPQPAHR